MRYSPLPSINFDEIRVKQMPMFSIIVPIYNSERYLKECIDSVLRQKLDDWELILIDDGSKDGSSAICDNFAKRDSRIAACHIPNAGPLAARSIGIAHSKGKYVVPLDSDDVLNPSALFICEEIIEQYHPDIVFMGITSNPDFSDDGCHDSIHGFYEADSFDLIRRQVCSGSFNSLSGRAFRREILSGVTSNRFMKFAEDWYQLLDIVKNSKTAFGYSHPLYYYRQNEDSTMHSPSLDNYDDLHVTFSKLSKMSREWGDGCYDLACKAMSQHLAGLLASSLLASSSDDELDKIAIKCAGFIDDFALGVPASLRPNEMYRALLLQLVRLGFYRVSRCLVELRTRLL